MSMEFLRRILDTRYNKALELRGDGINSGNAEDVHSKAESYCNENCDLWKINPMVSCAYHCKVWKVKNEALKFLASKKEESGSNVYVLALLEECKPIL